MSGMDAEASHRAGTIVELLGDRFRLGGRHAGTEEVRLRPGCRIDPQ